MAWGLGFAGWGEIHESKKTYIVRVVTRKNAVFASLTFVKCSRDFQSLETENVYPGGKSPAKYSGMP